MAAGSDLVQRARVYLGTPFAAGGRNTHSLDCGGLLLRVAEDLDLPLPAVPNYHLAFDCGDVGAYLRPFCERVETVQPGDFLLFALAKGVQHLGIASGEGTFLHAWDSPSVHEVTETPLDQWWQSRLLSVWRVRGLL